ncbi:MAG: ComEC/Rec2 family competence protein, partial [Arenicellales bacterium]|nr:ComEC/Rec2 family competence protein [Arenicellales bacterium]
MRVLAGCRIYIYAACFLTGAVVIQGVSELPSLWYFSPIPPFIALSFRFRWLWPLIFLSLGCAWAVLKADLLLAQALPRELEGKELQLVGMVSSLVQRNERYLKFTVDVESLSYLSHTYPPPKTIRLHWYHPDKVVHIGQGWRFRVRLKQPHGFQNPGGFDYEQWLFRHGIRATGYVLDADRRPETDHLSWWSVLRERVQHHLYHSGLAHQGLLRALAIGDRGGVLKEQWKVLQRTGTIHLMAISGLHIGLVSGFCFVIGLVIARLLGEAMLWLPAPKLGAVLGMAGAGIYALLAGFTVPTQRATVMVVALMTALLVDRSIDLTRSLAVALLIVLV